MAKVEELGPPGWDEPPLPLRARKPEPKKRHFQQLSLRHIMLALVYFALLFWVGRHVIETNEAIQKVILGVLVGLGFCGFGLWASMRMARYSFIAWIVFIIGFAMITGSTTSFFAIPMLPILIGSIIYLSYRRRSNNQDSLLWVMAVAAERGMPLDPGIRAFSSQVKGIYEVWTESLAELIRRGVGLPEALDSMPRLVPRSAALLIRMGSESGNLARGLREAVDSRSRQLPVLRSIAGRIAYLCWMVFVGIGIVGFVMYFIIPKFEAIFNDFGAELPEVTILMIRSSHVFVDYTWVPTMAFLAFGIIMAIKLLGGGDLSIPIVDRLLARRHTILILRSLVVVVEAGQPISSALFSLGQWYPTSWVRRKLKNAAIDVSRGHEWLDALSSTGLLSSSDVGVLASAQRAGNLAWALRELAETSERRWGYRLQAWTQVGFVLAMLVMGALVFLMAVAYFAPLTTLITRLAR
jgi:general secretion pathway protein F